MNDIKFPYLPVTIGLIMMILPWIFIFFPGTSEEPVNVINDITDCIEIISTTKIISEYTYITYKRTDGTYKIIEIRGNNFTCTNNHK